FCFQLPTPMSPNLFTPIQVGSVQLKNRIFMAPLTRMRAGTAHVPNDLMKEYYAQRSSAGLIIAENTMIAPHTTWCLLGRTTLLAWKEITDAVHAKEGKFFLQLCHGGRAAHPDNNDGVQPVGPSPIAIDSEVHTLHGKKKHVVPRELTANEISTIVQQFATAAKNSIDVAGFDGVEIHAANGFFIDQFVRSSANTRTDQYGGSLQNRTRIVAEILQAVTAVVHPDKLQRDERRRSSQHLAALCQRYDLAYVHILRGDFLSVQEGDIEPIFRTHFHNTLVSNMGYTKDEANAAIQAGRVDAVSFGVPFLANPDLPKRFATGATLNDADPSTFYVGGAKGYTSYPTLADA
ncbi:unnamed protein product, partial [Aphanomyces euteiches]